MGNQVITRRIKGITQYYVPRHLNEFHIGEFLRLIPEFDNPYDSNALLIMDEKGNKLGYVEKGLNVELYRIMCQGDYYCIISSVYANIDVPSIEYQFVFKTPNDHFDVPQNIFYDRLNAYKSEISGFEGDFYNPQPKSYPEKIDELKQSYAQIKDLITELATNDSCQALMKTNDSQAIFGFFMERIDLVLQQLMIRIFCSLDNFDLEDFKFIRDFPEYDDILIHYSPDEDWETIYYEILSGEGTIDDLENWIIDLFQTDAVQGTMFSILSIGFLYIPLFEFQFKMAFMLFILQLAFLRDNDRSECQERNSMGMRFINEQYFNEFDEWRRENSSGG
jgi:hypothetical protein